ncbi:hypothetical protein [Dyadobacter frigoris]|uniref:DUF5672 domain-containing protein n=1 Tax=Dyadobacter frigoris TaxID=2576211 RepID=A0A4U6CTJ1_9BACT|nr:hypothetical protein [Dyadobacter frigoris]TKT87990.1 hypothetical protein FDK13_28220 [Dyadobacter frigoris]GLU52889.1 hypothetical protein Dfri01_23500 [Dyadobacter frigoris]
MESILNNSLRNNSVDVAIQMHGKPLMTAVAISSLLKNSGRWINKIYLIEERQQPFCANGKFIARHYPDKVIRYRPYLFHGLLPANKLFFKWQFYRNSVRYQYAFENSDRKYLYIIHNDVLFHDDILGMYLNHIECGSYAGVGPIGMCWNCPAHSSGHCSSDNYLNYRPTTLEFSELAQKYHAPRKEIYDLFKYDEGNWPLPECRLNEWSALIDREQTAPYQFPYYKDILFGQMDLDTAVRWFHHMNNHGLQFKNVPLGSHATHVWTGREGEANSGMSTMNNQELYFRAEKMSYQKLISDYGFTDRELTDNKPW